MQEKEIWKDTPKTDSGFSGGEIWSDFYFPLCNSVLTPFFKNKDHILFLYIKFSFKKKICLHLNVYQQING